MASPVSKEDQPRAYNRDLRIIERIGQGGLSVTIAVFIALGVAWEEPYEKVWSLVLAHFVTGRAGNIVLGIKLGFPTWFLFLQCFVQDLLMCLLLYPLFVAGYRRAVEWRILGPALANIRATADRHKSKIEPFGAAGLVLFVLIPFWSTGALVGAVVGYLLRLRTWVTFAAVTIGNFFAVAIWIYLIQHGIEALAHFEERTAPGYILAAVVAVLILALALHVRGMLRPKNATQDDAGGKEEPASQGEDDSGH